MKTIVGWDIGHAQTSIARSQANVNKDQDVDIMELPNTSKDNGGSWVTAYLTKPNGESFLGMGAINAAKEGAVPFMAFKAPPRAKQGENPEVSERSNLHIPIYAKILLDHMCRQYTDMKDFEIIVGCPSGWKETDADECKETPSQQAHYQSLLTKAIHPIPVTVVPESRAAMMQAISKGSTILEEHRGLADLLIIDLGSSTLDFTFIKRLPLSKEGKVVLNSIEHDRALSIDVGYPLGAGVLEEMLLARRLHIAHEQGEEDWIRLSKAEWVQTKMLHVCRLAKERWFSNCPKEGPNGNEEGEESFKIFVENSRPLKFRVDASEMPEIIHQKMNERYPFGGQSWVEAFRDCLQKAANEFKRHDLHPRVILMVGGASRMYFIKPEVEAIYPPEKSNVYDTPGPELYVAKGLARWGRRKWHMAQFREKIDLALKENLEKVVKNRILEYVAQLAEAIAKDLVNGPVLAELRYWRNGYRDTIQNSISAMERDAKEWLQGPKAREIQAQILQKIRKQIEADFLALPAVKSACAGTFVDYEFFCGILIKEMDPTSSPLNVLVADVFAGSADVLDEFLGTIATIILGALIAFGPFGLVAATIMALVFLFTSKEAVYKLNLPEWVRKLVSDEGIEKTGKEMIEKVKTGASTQLLADKELMARLQGAIVSMVEARVQSAAKLELLALV